MRSLSRPRVSNDHPQVESLFKTTTYSAGSPDRFTDFAHAEPWCAAFVTYDNTMHKHSGIAYCTPAMVYGGDAPAVLAQRHRTMTRPFALTPARFVRGAPRTATLPTTVSIHPIAEHHAAAINSAAVSLQRFVGRPRDHLRKLPVASTVIETPRSPPRFSSHAQQGRAEQPGEPD